MEVGETESGDVSSKEQEKQEGTGRKLSLGQVRIGVNGDESGSFALKSGDEFGGENSPLSPASTVPDRPAARASFLSTASTIPIDTDEHDDVDEEEGDLSGLGKEHGVRMPASDIQSWLQTSQGDLTDIPLEGFTANRDAPALSSTDIDANSPGSGEEDITPKKGDFHDISIADSNLEVPTGLGAPERSPTHNRARSRDFDGHRPRSYDGRLNGPPIAARAPSPVRTEYGADDDDLASVRTDMTTRTLKANRPQPVTKSKKIGQMQNVFTESQKIAYVGLCYLSIVHFRATRLNGMKKATQAYDEWAKKFMERLYVYLDVIDEERVMIKNLADHGLVPADLSVNLINDAKKAAEQIAELEEQRQKAEQEALDEGRPMDFPPIEETATESDTPSDIRYTILSHLFILCIADGSYDARSRAMLRAVSKYLEVPWGDVIKLENTIADQLRIYEDSEEVKGDMQVVEERNKMGTKQRWLLTGVATLAGGAVIGLTAGLAAPLIAGGIGVALATFGVSGASTVLASSGALALITTGGVLTGGGMGGTKMLKRTRGITEFEFLPIDEALRRIEESKEKRRTQRRKRRRREAREKLQEKMQQEGKSLEETKNELDKLDEAESPDGEKVTSMDTQEADAEVQPGLAAAHKKHEMTASWVSLTESHRQSISLPREDSSKKVAPAIPERPAFVLQKSPTASSTQSPTPTSATPSTAASTHDEPIRSPEILWESSHISSEDGDEINRGDITLDRAGTSDAQTTITKLSDFDDTITNDGSDIMFDDLQSTIAGDVPAEDDEGIRFKESEGPLKAKQTNVLITIAGWVTYGFDDHTLPFSTLEPNVAGDQYSLIWETQTLTELGSALKLLVGEIASFVFTQGLQATVLSALMAGLAGPMWVMKLSYLVDNPWGNGLTKANKAGKVLADTLMQNSQDSRPVTLIGYSLGARVIYHCLLELVNKGAHGLVEEAYMFGCPVMGSKKEWEQISSVVSGRVVNGYCSNDMVLGVLYRASMALWKDVAGLRPVSGVPGVENIPLDDVIKGHLDYRLCMPKVLEKCGFSVTRDYFDDEDEEEEKERLEMEEERKREKEERLRAKEERLKKKQAEYEEKVRKKAEETERKKREKEELRKKKEEEKAKAEEERKRKEAEKAQKKEADRLAKEAAAKEGRRSGGWFGRKKSASTTPTTPTAAAEEALEEFWMPREIKSTMPTLVVPKEIQSTLPPLVISMDEDGSGGAENTEEEETETELEDTPRDPSASVSSLDIASAHIEEPDIAQAEAEMRSAAEEVEKAKAEVAEAVGVVASLDIQKFRMLEVVTTGESLEDLIKASRVEVSGLGAGDVADRREASETEEEEEETGDGDGWGGSPDVQSPLPDDIANPWT
ncbi:hypothetical protein HDV00_011803 [Rhizophlyctis rosea]|nr:hypothetical protein HDV00_011803 [Rhizophlyctis rosea]